MRLRHNCFHLYWRIGSPHLIGIERDVTLNTKSGLNGVESLKGIKLSNPTKRASDSDVFFSHNRENSFIILCEGISSILPPTCNTSKMFVSTQFIFSAFRHISKSLSSYSDWRKMIAPSHAVSSEFKKALISDK